MAEIFGVVLRFLKNGPDGLRVTHRLVALRFYDRSFSSAQLAVVITDILMRDFGFRRNQIRASISDGCPTNGSAMEQLKHPLMLPHILTPICISHSSNVVGKLMLRQENCPLPLAKRFEEIWSQLLNTSPRARSLFQQHSHQTAKRSSDIRWFCWFEIIQQAYLHFDSVQHVIQHQDL